jgi:hypothetical protein
MNFPLPAGPEGDQSEMKKLSDMHGPRKVPASQNDTSASLNAPAYSENKPKGVMDHSHPGHVSRGAAESNANPVKETQEVSNTEKRQR